MLGRFLTTKEQIVLYGLVAALLVGAVVAYSHGRSVAVEPPPVAKELPMPIERKEPPAPQPEPPTRTTEPQPLAPPASVPNESQVRAGDKIAVSVAGAVRRPGLYQFSSDARVQDAVVRAGGALPDADVRDLNLAATLMDGTTLVVPVGQKAAVEGRRMVMRGGQSAAAVNLPQYTISGGQQTQAAGAAVKASPPAALPTYPVAAVGQATATGAGDGLIDLNRASARELESLPGIGPVLAQSIIKYREQTPFQSLDDVNNVPGIGRGKLEAMRPFATVQPVTSNSAGR